MAGHTTTYNRDTSSDIPAIKTATRDSTQDSKDTFYTLSATPSVGDLVYDSSKQSTGKTITAIGSGTISWSDTYTITCTFDGTTLSSVSGTYISINGTSYDFTTNPRTFTINQGDSVEIILRATVETIRVIDSNNTTYIPNVGGDNEVITIPSFSMPNENLTFTLLGTGEPL